jgi:carbon storage regulator CsrA
MGNASTSNSVQSQNLDDKPLSRKKPDRSHIYSYIASREGHKTKGGNMLVLSRKRDEKILLQLNEREKIELTVVRIDNNKVRLGIDAEDNVTILRSELLDRTTPKVATA